MAEENEASQEIQGSEQTTASEESTEEQRPQEDDESTETQKKLTEAGRKRKAAEEEAKKLREENEALRKAREELWFKHEASEQEKDEYRRRLERDKKESPQIARLTNENSLLRAISEEENSVVKKALRGIYAKAEKTGKFPDPETVQALRESLLPEDDESPEEETQRKAPPKVNATRGTRSITASPEEELKAARESVKKRDGRYTAGDLLVLEQQVQMAKASAR